MGFLGLFCFLWGIALHITTKVSLKEAPESPQGQAGEVAFQTQYLPGLVQSCLLIQP